MTTFRIYDTDTRLFRFTLTAEDGTAIADAAEVAMRLYSLSALVEERLLSLGGVTNEGGGIYSSRFGPLVEGFYVLTATGESVNGNIKSESASLHSVALAPEVS